jgi:hypothetical protein
MLAMQPRHGAVIVLKPGTERPLKGLDEMQVGVLHQRPRVRPRPATGNLLHPADHVIQAVDDRGRRRPLAEKRPYGPTATRSGDRSCCVDLAQ